MSSLQDIAWQVGKLNHPTYKLTAWTTCCQTLHFLPDCQQLCPKLSAAVLFFFFFLTFPLHWCNWRLLSTGVQLCIMRPPMKLCIGHNEWNMGLQENLLTVVLITIISVWSFAFCKDSQHGECRIVFSLLCSTAQCWVRPAEKCSEVTELTTAPLIGPVM